jgi:hypothetical protein
LARLETRIVSTDPGRLPRHWDGQARTAHNKRLLNAAPIGARVELRETLQSYFCTQTLTKTGPCMWELTSMKEGWLIGEGEWEYRQIV